MNSKSIAIFGGSFDPPHLGHRYVVRQLMNLEKISYCYIIPNRQSPLKKSKTVSNRHILEMIYLNFQRIKNINISSVELKKSGLSYTIDTINEFAKKNNSLILLIGEDNYYNFHQWKNYLIILKKVKKIYVFKRYKNKFIINKNIKKYHDKFHFIKNKIIEISSDEIRKNVKKFSKYLHKDVFNYIQVNKLYINTSKKVKYK